MKLHGHVARHGLAAPARGDGGPAPSRRDCLGAIGGALLGPVAGAVLAGPPEAAARHAALTLGSAVYGTPSPFSDAVKAIVMEAGRRADIAIDFKPLPLLRVLEMANQGEVDGDPIRIAGTVDRYPNLVQVPTPVIHSTLAVYGSTPAIAQRTRAELRAMPAGKMRGVLIAAKHTAGMETTDAVSSVQLLEMLRTGRCQIVIAEYIDLEVILKAQPQPAVHRWPHAWASEPLYTLLNRRHAALVPRLDAALQSMKRDGQAEVLVEQVHRSYGVAPPPAVEPVVPR